METHKSPIFQNPEFDGGTFFWPGNSDQKTAVLLLHGFTATTVEVRPMAEYLNQQGYTVSGPLLPGHGVSPEELNHVQYKDWIAAAENMYFELSKSHDRIFVIGESMGGLCSLWLAAKHPEIRGVMVFAPALKIKRLWESRLIWPFIHFFPKKNITLNSPWQGFNVVPLHAASQLHRFQQEVRKLLQKIDHPTLIFQGKLDKTINPMSAVEVLESISSDDKELVWLEEAQHCILLEKNLDTVKNICIGFIRKLE